MNEFFERYCSAFVNLAPSDISDFYVFPVTFYTETGEVVILEENGFLENTKKLFNLYQDLGVSEIGFQLLAQQNLNGLFNLVSVKWTYARPDGTEIFSATTRYLIKINTLKIASVIAVDEMSIIGRLLNR